MLKKGNQWEDKDFKKSTYLWMLNRQRLVPCKRPDDLNLIYSDYRTFLR